MLFLQTCSITKEAHLFLSHLLLEFLEPYRELGFVVSGNAKWPSAYISAVSVPSFLELMFILRLSSDRLPDPHLAVQCITFLHWDNRKSKYNIYSFTSFGDSIEM